MQRELDLFHEVLQQRPGDRAAFIESRHAGDPELIRRLMRLLDAHERAERSEKDTLGRAAPVVAGVSVLDFTPERIGPYRILETIGEGGMGVVYAAEQTEPLRRRVAIKIIKAGMDSREVVGRFEAERQALAMMDHPCVAKVLDAGVTERGRPYFVMELVKGLPLVEYCVKHRLPLRERLALFCEVCGAVQHAHQKGIIHRDLKPSNILVGVQEGRPSPKVIDFGVAKATAARLTERTVFTEQGRLIGTPEYMSPEQAEMSGLDVDTRTDVYSLGVILYELLTGVVPFDAKALRQGGYPELMRTIREVEPQRPSTRLAGLERLPEGTPAGLETQSRLVKGELDWIVMRAIAKDRTRRYPTAAALGDDVERYLADRPVQAGPPSAAYAVRKFVRRHRYATAMIVIVALSAMIGVTGLWIGLVRAREAEALATQRADNAQAAAAFLERVLFQADPEFAGRSLTLDELMAFASGSIERDLGAYPEVEASVRESIGVAYRRRSLFPPAEPHLRRSLELRTELFGVGDPRTARSQVAMADLIFEYRGSIDEALELLRQAHAAFVAHGMEGSAAEGWLLLDIGLVSLDGDRLGDAERAFERCRELMAEHLGVEHRDVSRPVRGLAMVAMHRGDLVRAERLAREAVRLCSGEGAVYIGARAKLVLARVLIEAGRMEEASAMLEQAGDQFSATVGLRHIRIAERDALIAAMHLRQGEYGEAAVVAERCEGLRREILRPDHLEEFEARLLLQRARIGTGRLAGAEETLREIDEGVRRRLPQDHPLAIQVARALVESATMAGDATLAEARTQRLALLEQRRAQRLRRDGDGAVE